MRWCLGGLWLLDGVLQLQPAMFTAGFVHSVLLPAIAGQPPWLEGILGWAALQWRQHLVLADLGAALLQIGIGVAMWACPTRLRRPVLWVSLGWGLIVWAFGEGLGGIFVAGSSVVLGAPGSAVLYVAGAAILLTSQGCWQRLGFRQGVRWALAGFWGWGAWLQMREPFWRGSRLGDLVLASARQPQPHWIQALLMATGTAWQTYPWLTNSILVAGMLILAVGWLRPHPGAWWLGFNGVWIMGMWAVGMDFGVLGGTGTDPNTGPLLLLWSGLAWAMARPRTRRQGEDSKEGMKVLMQLKEVL